jgi:hypothetical protein
VGGDQTVRVRALPSKRMTVRRRLENTRGEAITARAALDDLLAVHVEIRSGGGPRSMYGYAMR